MRKNDHTGAVHLPLRGVGEVEIRFDWEAIAALQALYGKSWESDFREAVTEMRTEDLAQILAIATKHSAKWWTEQSPEIVPIADALHTALEIAFVGAGGLPTSTNPKIALNLLTRFLGALKLGSRSEAVSANSGN